MAAAAPSVLSELAKTGLPLEAQAFCAAVIQGETPQAEGPGYSPWNILYSGAGALVGAAGLVNQGDQTNILMVGRWRYWIPPLATFPAWHGGKLASGNWSTAAGGPQITGSTWRDNNGFGITVFDPHSQSVFCWKLAQFRFARHYDTRDLLTILKGTDADRMLVNAYLKGTWPGGCDTGFPKRYASNLAALQASPTPTPVPQPTPDPVPTTASVTVSVVDQAGRKGSATIPLVAAALVTMVSGAVIMAPKPAVEVASAPIVQEEVAFPSIQTAVMPPEPGQSGGSTYCPPKDLRWLLAHTPCSQMSAAGR